MIFLNIGKILNLVTENNIKVEDVIKLAQKVNTLNLKDEKNVREIINDVKKIANKDISKEKEDMLVKKILDGKVNEKNINEEIINMM